MSNRIKKTEGNVSSPNATGGGGTHFEQHVDAAFLAWLLVGAISPVFTNSQINEVHLQAEHKGWQTDDVIVETRDNAGLKHILACQVKQAVTVSDKDDEFRKTLADAWADFNNSTVFDPTRDGIAIITLRGTDVLLRHFALLLNTARHTRTEIKQRLFCKFSGDRLRV